jgi:hypothetical protein
MTFLVVLVSFIPGLALVRFVLDPLLNQGYRTQAVVLPELLGVAPPYVTAVLAIGALVGLYALRRRSR